MNAPIAIAKEAARRAGALLLSLMGKTAVEHKDSGYNLVTAADRGSEKLIVDFLLDAMPGSAFLAEEEHTDTDLSAERLWIIDPLDGTTNFAYEIPHYGVSIAYAEGGTIVAGVVYDPCRDELFSAVAGGGAFRNDEPISVSRRAPLSQSLIATGFYYDRDLTMEKTLRALRRLFKRDIRCMRRMGAATLDLAWLACGRFDGYFEYTLSPWDFAAGLLIVTEAGGGACDPAGKGAGLFSRGLICSNGLIQEELMECTIEREESR